MELSSKSQSWLSWFLRGILVLVFLFLVSRLFELQIIKGKYYRELSENNRVRKIELAAPRGKIVARGGEVLVGNSEIKKRLVFKKEGGFELSDNTSGVDKNEIVSTFQRYYSLGPAFAHAGGYLGEVGEDEVKKVNPKCSGKGPWRPGDFVGRGGLEEEYDCSLRGIPGEELIEVDITGKVLRILGKVDPIPGKDLKTNIDFGLQKKVAEEMMDKKGAFIATDPRGEVLAFYSAPSYDPNLFVKSGNSEEINSLFKNSNLPLFNRVIGGLYHPGSVFKPTIAVAALEEGKIDKNYRYTDTGVIKVNDYLYTNWYFTQYGRTEGEIGLTRAMARSTDTFFYKVGEIVGIDKLARYAKEFGYSEESGVDLPGEVAGLIPTPEWKKKVKNEIWFLGNTYHFSIGQGDVAVSPIEVNRAIAAIANDGYICQPKLVGTPRCSNLNLKKETLDLVKQGMEGVCSEGGTGYTFFDFSLKYDGKNVLCKTGTAETNDDKKTHAWFTLIAPSNLPEIVATTLVEGGGEGAAIAGPIARKIMDYWMIR